MLRLGACLGDDARQDCKEAIHLLLRVEAPQADAQQPASLVGIVPHGEQNARRLASVVSIASAARGDSNASLIERVKQFSNLPIEATQPEAEMPGQALCSMPEEI